MPLLPPPASTSPFLLLTFPPVHLSCMPEPLLVFGAGSLSYIPFTSPQCGCGHLPLLLRDARCPFECQVSAAGGQKLPAELWWDVNSFRKGNFV